MDPVTRGSSLLNMPFNLATGLARPLIIMRAAAPITGLCEAQSQSSLHLHIKHTTSPHTTVSI
jgi:hypothetical protein